MHGVIRSHSRPRSMLRFTRNAPLLTVAIAAAIVVSVGAALTASAAAPRSASLTASICRSKLTRHQVDAQLLVRLRADIATRFPARRRNAVWHRLVRNPTAAYRQARIWS